MRLVVDAPMMVDLVVVEEEGGKGKGEGCLSSLDRLLLEQESGLARRGPTSKGP